MSQMTTEYLYLKASQRLQCLLLIH